MADTRTIYLHTGIETFSSDPSDLQFLYLDMSDYDNLNPQYQSTIKLSSGVAGIYESTKAKITLTFKGENSGRDARADWVNKYAERINKISVNTTENKSAVFNKSATVSEVEFIDTPYIDGAQVIIEVTMFGRWQSALTILETVSEKYEGGNKTYLGKYPDYNKNTNLLLGTKNWVDSTRWELRGTLTTDSYQGLLVASTSIAWTTPRYNIKNTGVLQIGNIYTFSTYVRNTSDTDTTVGFYYDDSIVKIIEPIKFVKAHTDWTRIYATFEVIKDPSTSTEKLRWESSADNLANGFVQLAGYKLELGEMMSDYSENPNDLLEKRTPHYTYNYTYGITTLQNQIALPKDRNRFMLAIDSQYSVATITLSANGKRATISTSRLSANSSLSSDFVAYDITAFVDTDKFLLLNSGLVASIVWDNLASQYAVLYQIMNSVGDKPADISVTTTGGQHIPFKLYTYSVQDFI